MEKQYTKTITQPTDFDAGLKAHPDLKAKYTNSNVGASDVSVVFSEDLDDYELMRIDEYVANYQDLTDEKKVELNILVGVGAFVQTLLLEYAAGNIVLGITAAGKTKAVADYLQKLHYYLMTYSLHAAIEEIDAIITAGVDPTLAPFITDARLTAFKTKIQDFLA